MGRIWRALEGFFGGSEPLNTEPGQSDWISLDTDPRPDVQRTWAGAVLLSDEIEYYCSLGDYPLIQPFDRENLKPARYQLTLGDEARIDGRVRKINGHRPLIIAPHQVAIVKTYEKLNIPRFLIARWNLTVDRVYEGLLWVGALQVDPGWVGYLPCPLYNMSDKPVQIDFREKLFTIDFVRTTPYRQGISKAYSRSKPPNPPLQIFDPHHLRSGPYEALQKLQEVLEFRNMMVGAIAILVAVLAAIVGALGLVAVWPVARAAYREAELLTWVPIVALATAFLAICLSLFAAIISWHALRRHQRALRGSRN